MSQNDFTLANQSFPAFRADLNSALQALATNSSGGSAPSTTFANMWWYDTSNNIMYIRNEDNDAWIKFAELDQANDKFVLSGTLQLDDGTVSAPALTFNSDTNMGIYRGGTDILKFVTAGTDRLTIDASGVITSEVNGAVKNLDLNNEADTPFMTFSESGAVNFFIGESSIIGGGGVGFYDLYATSGLGQRFFTNALKRMQIESNGDINLGYEDTGTTPKLFWDATDEQLYLSGTVNNSTRPQVSLDGGSGGSGRSAGISGLASGTNATDLLFFTNADTDIPNERMRIDNSGNLFVGNTAEFVDGTGTGDTGIQINPIGLTISTRNGGISGIFGRQSSDGDILQFRKDGSAIGSIGTVSNRLYMVEGNTGFSLVDTGNAIYPAESDGTNRDNAIDLGASGARWKDLYLSGGVYLGGTGSANYLDDYEEGTFNPIYLGATTNPSVTYDTNVRFGAYTKIGRICYFNLVIRTDDVASTGSGTLRVGNLPFTASNAFTVSCRYAVSIGRATNFNNARSDIVGEIEVSSTYIQLYYNHGINGFDATELKDGTNQSQFEISGFYVVA